MYLQVRARGSIPFSHSCNLSGDEPFSTQGGRYLVWSSAFVLAADFHKSLRRCHHPALIPSFSRRPDRRDEELSTVALCSLPVHFSVTIFMNTGLSLCGTVYGSVRCSCRNVYSLRSILRFTDSLSPRCRRSRRFRLSASRNLSVH